MSESPSTDSVWGWRGAASGIVESMNQILHTEERSDVVFAVGREHGEEKLFRAHKFVLSLRSDVFDAMFYGEAATTEKTIELSDILPQAFGVMLKYMYANDVEDLNVENVMPTLYCAKKYGLPKLLDICAEYAIENVDMDSCLTLLEAAKLLDEDDLVSKCLKIVDSRCTDVLRSEGFLLLKNETVREIFSRDTLIVNEEDVYKAAQRWAANACRIDGIEPAAVSCRCVLGETLHFVRFPLMDDEQLANGPVASGLLLDEELRNIRQFKSATEKPDIPFSGTSRSSEIAFCGRLWKIVAKSIKPDISSWMMNMGSVFLDDEGHLHLRISQYDGVWQGAGVLLPGAFGCGRYEFHIERLGRSDSDATFQLASQIVNGPVVGISLMKSRVRDGEGQEIFNFVRFFVDNSAHFDWLIEGDTRTTYSFHLRPDNSVSFSSQRGFQCNNSEMELCNWLYESASNISEIDPLCIFFRADPMGNSPYDGKEVEIVVHSFLFYPDE